MMSRISLSECLGVALPLGHLLVHLVQRVRRRREEAAALVVPRAALDSITATGSPERRPKKSASMPDEKKHIGSWALPGAASAQSLESRTRAALPSCDTLTEPQPVARKNADKTSFSRPASSSSGRATPVSPGSQVQNA